MCTLRAMRADLVIVVGLLIACHRRPLAPGEIRCVTVPIGNIATTRCRTGQPVRGAWWCEAERDGACSRTPQGCSAMKRGACIRQGIAACFESTTPERGVDMFCISTLDGCVDLREFMIANAHNGFGVPRSECSVIE